MEFHDDGFDDMEDPNNIPLDSNCSDTDDSSSGRGNEAFGVGKSGRRKRRHHRRHPSSEPNHIPIHCRFCHKETPPGSGDRYLIQICGCSDDLNVAVNESGDQSGATTFRPSSPLPLEIKAGQSVAGLKGRQIDPYQHSYAHQLCFVHHVIDEGRDACQHCQERWRCHPEYYERIMARLKRVHIYNAFVVLANVIIGCVILLAGIFLSAYIVKWLVFLILSQRTFALFQIFQVGWAPCIGDLVSGGLVVSVILSIYGISRCCCSSSSVAAQNKITNTKKMRRRRPAVVGCCQTNDDDDEMELQTLRRHDNDGEIVLVDDDDGDTWENAPGTLKFPSELTQYTPDELEQLALQMNSARSPRHRLPISGVALQTGED